MDLVDIELLKVLMRYGCYCIGWGMIVIVPLEMSMFGIMKAFRLLKL